jgi:hypothetical protein
MADAMQEGVVIANDSMRVPRFQAAYQRVVPRLAAIDKRDLLVVNLDIPRLVMIVVGAISEMRKLREACAKSLPDFDLSVFDEIESLALAMGYTHGLHAAASVPILPVRELSARAVEMRLILARDCAALAQRGLIDSGGLKELRGPVGYKNQAFDLLTLVALMRGRWRFIKGKCAVSEAELDEAESVADQLLTAVGEREQLPQVTAAAADVRRRAFTLFVRAYDELRGAAEYLRRHDRDADAFVPSLYSARKRRETARPTKPEDAPSSNLPAVSEGPKKAEAIAPASVPSGDPFSAA